MISKIKKQLLEKRNDYEKQYIQGCLNNSAHVMHNASIKVMAYDKVISIIDNYKSIDKFIHILETLRLISLSRYGKFGNKPNGHFIHSEIYKEIIINIKCCQ